MKKETANIRVLLIGLGNIAVGYEYLPQVKKRMRYPTHWSVLRKDKRFTVVAAVDPLRESRESFKKVSDCEAVYADYTVALKKHTFDVAIICTPTQTHAQVIADCAKAGIVTILCEKPLAYSASDIANIQKVVKKYKVKILCNYFRSFEETYHAFGTALVRGSFGKVRSVHITYSGGVFNMASHALALVYKWFGDFTNIQTLKHSIRTTAADPSVSFSALAGTVPVVATGIGDHPCTLR